MDIQLKKQYPLYSPSFWSAYFVQMRPYLLFISGIAGVTGISMHPNPFIGGWKPYVAAILFFFAYGFGQALTDCFQTDTDKISAPYRPLSKEIVSKRDVFLVSISCLMITGILFYWLNPVAFILSLAAVFGLATYSYIKRNFWFAGPFYNAWIVALLPWMGFFSTKDGTSSFSLPAILPYAGISFFSYASFVLIGYLKDITADRATGYKTFPVVFGWDKTILIGDVFALATMLLAWLQPLTNIPELIVRIAASIIIVTGQGYGHFTKIKNEKGALIPIIATVRGFILIHASIILHFQPRWLIFLACFYLLFEITLYRRPSKYQV